MHQTSSEHAVLGHNAALHDAVRPAWSGELLSWLLGSPASNHRLQVLDLGAGTGLGTRTIAALGHEVTAVDTADDMLTVLIKARQKLPLEVAKRIATATGSAEHIPLKDQSVDAITCLQAWHWMDPVKAVTECDRVLRPNGTVGLAWHTWDRTSEWVKALADIVEPDGPPADQTQSVPTDFAGRGAFELKEFPFDYELTATRLVQLAASWTFVSQRSDSSSVLSKVRHLSEQAASSSTGLVRFPHITAAFRLRGQKVD